MACELERVSQEELCNCPHVVVEIPVMMLDEFGSQLIKLHEEVSE